MKTYFLTQRQCNETKQEERKKYWQAEEKEKMCKDETFGKKSKQSAT